MKAKGQKAIIGQRAHLPTSLNAGSLPADVVVPWLPSGGTGVFSFLGQQGESPARHDHHPLMDHLYC